MAFGNDQSVPFANRKAVCYGNKMLIFSQVILGIKLAKNTGHLFLPLPNILIRFRIRGKRLRRRKPLSAKLLNPPGLKIILD